MKLDLTLVSYLNTRPFLDGLESVFHKEQAEYHLLPPFQCAQHLAEKQCDLSLIPVGSLFDFKDLRLLPNYCIGADGPVHSVYIFSELPIEQVETIYLDPHSRTSNLLSRILAKHYWQKDITFIKDVKHHHQYIRGNSAGVVIGDLAIRIRDMFPYVYDLSECWKLMTGLPFAFAVWAYHPGALDPYLINQIQEGFRKGVSQAGQTARKWAAHFDIPQDFAVKYLEEYIDFKFDAKKHDALKLYLNLAQGLGVLPPTPAFV
ncbi:MAG: menaquinone biosynthesis protein [Bacteroidota bacterium]